MSDSYKYIYIHLPFCQVICHYCDFYKTSSKEADHGALFSALQAHLVQIADQLAPKLASVYLGGGTPALSPAPLLEKFLNRLDGRIDANTEVTLEANPNDLTNDAMSAWRSMGINRLSVGVQSLNPKLLKQLSRTHTREQSLERIAAAAKGFSQVSSDLLFAVPGQTVEEPADDALQLVDAGVSHLSAYHLTLDSEHFMKKRQPVDTHTFEQIRLLRDSLVSRGFEQYEVSNFAPPGKEAIHNRSYWQGLPYMALGPSAHGFDGKKRRWQNIADWRKYIARIEDGLDPIDFEETLNQEQRYIEDLFTRLRTREGLCLDYMRDTYGHGWLSRSRPLLDEYVKRGLALWTNDRFSLTFQGLMLADEIVEKLSAHN